MKLNFKPMALLAMGLVLAVNVQAENEVTAVTSEAVEDIAFMLPDIQFVVLEDGRVKISMIGFRRQDIASFHFNELDITSDIELNIANKNLSGTDFRIDKFTDINNVEVLISPVHGFDMVLMSEIEPFALDGNVFSVKLTNGLEIRRTISFEESKGFFSALAGCTFVGVVGAGVGVAVGGPVGAVVGGAAGCAYGASKTY